MRVPDSILNDSTESELARLLYLEEIILAVVMEQAIREYEVAEQILDYIDKQDKEKRT